MNDLERARQLFTDAGLTFPTIPDELAARLREQGKWLFSTRELRTSPYNLEHYVQERDRTRVTEYAVLAHSGHGVNSYAIQYYLVYGPLRMFLHLGWGGVYMNRDVTSLQIRQCFSLADDVLAAATNLGTLDAGNRVTIVGSDFYGSYWSAPGQSREKEKKDSKRPAEMLAEVLHYFENQPPNTLLEPTPSDDH